MIADWIFTSTSAIIQIITGLLLADFLNLTLSSGWVFWALCLYFFVGACWLPVVWIQIKMRNIAKQAFEDNTPLPNSYWIFNRWWIILGSLAFPAMIIIFYIMVFKPNT